MNRFLFQHFRFYVKNLSLYLSFLASSSSVLGSSTVNNIKESTISPSSNATSLMSKALAGFGTASPAKPKSTASPLGAAVVAAAQAQAASEAKQQHSPTAKAVANVVTGRYAMLAHTYPRSYLISLGSCDGQMI